MPVNSHKQSPLIVLAKAFFSFLLLGVFFLVILSCTVSISFSESIQDPFFTILCLTLFLLFAAMYVLLLRKTGRKFGETFAWWRRWFVVPLAPAGAGVMWIIFFVFQLTIRFIYS